MKRAIFLLCGILTLGLVADTDPVTSVTVSQRWPFSRLVDVTVVLDTVPEPVDLAFSFSNGSRAYPIPEAALTGDETLAVTAGTHRYVFDPALTAVGDVDLLTRFKLKVEAKAIPLYMIVNLEKDHTGSRLTFLTKDDIRTGAYGAYTEDYSYLYYQDQHAAHDKFIWTGLTDAAVYAKYAVTNMVFRRLPAGKMMMNWTWDPGVTFSKPIYASVFEFTRGYARMLGEPFHTFGDGLVSLSKPVFNCRYREVRGSAEEGVDWPTTGHEKVAPGSYIGLLRARVGGGVLFDMPTECEALYAYAGGSSTFGRFVDGQAYAFEPGAPKSNEVANAFCRYKYNGGWGPNNDWASSWNNATDPHVGHAPVGSYLPNGFGLYDVAGNVEEMTLSRNSKGWGSPYRCGVDPAGPTAAEAQAIGSDGSYVVVGGSSHGGLMTQTDERKISGDEQSSTAGFRVFAPVTRAMYDYDL